jgi:hypothetical protein
MTRPSLIPVEEMVRVPGLAVPSELYTVLSSPALLAGMPCPGEGTPWAALAEAGFRNVICLMGAAPSYNPTPLRLLHAVELEDLVGGRSPVDPDRERRDIGRAVRIALGALHRNEGVIVHCEGGTGRTGTVIGLVLRHLGWTAAETLGYLNAIHRARERAGWPESPWQAELLETINGLV